MPTVTEDLARYVERTPSQTAPSDALVKLLAHPLRRRILELLNQRVLSPSELAIELDAKLGDVGYHVGRLLDAGAIELVRTEPRRGALKHFYRANTRALFPTEQFALLPLSARRAIFSELFKQISHDVRRASETGGFDRPDVHVSWTPLDLDEPGYQAMVEAADAALDRALEVQAEVAQRRADGESPADGVRSELVLLHFLRAPEARSTADRRDAPQATPAARERAFTAAEDLCDELAAGEPDWTRARELIGELHALVEALATAERTS